MYRRTILMETALAADSLHFVESRNSVYATTADGRLIAIRLFDGRVVELGTGYASPVAVAPLTDGLRLAVAESDGAILVVGRNAADRNRARLLAQLPSAVLALDEHPDSDALLVLSDKSPDGTLPQLLRCDLETGDVEVLAADLEGARSMSVDPVRRTAVTLSVMSDGSRTLTTIELDDGATNTVAAADYDHISDAPGSPALFATRSDPASPDTDLLTYWDGGETTTEPLPGRVDGLTRWGSLVLIASGAELHAVEWDVEDGDLPIDAPLGPLIVGGYARLSVNLPALGLAPGAVTYSVREGDDAGSISLGVEPSNPDGTESVTLLAGFQPGEFHLEAKNAASGSLLAVRRFRVTTLWPDDAVGPPIAVTGDVGATLMNWGGAGGVVGYRFPTPPREWHVLVVLLYLNDRKFDDENATRNEWKDRMIGLGGSIRQYYEEVSAYKADPQGHGMTIKLVGDQVFGPVAVGLGWGDVFKQREDPALGWKTTKKGKTALASALRLFFGGLTGDDEEIMQANSLVFVVRSGSDGPISMGAGNPDLPTKYVWGHAAPVTFSRMVGFPPKDLVRPVSFVSDRYPAGAPTGDLMSTTCHEIGHNLGLGDLYNDDGDYPAEVIPRLVGAMDLMDEDVALPHFSLANRIALGWIDPAWLRRFDFTIDPHGDSVVLQSTETIGAGGPTSGRKAGIEVPINGDQSYLFEYRFSQPRQIGDQSLNPTVAPSMAVICGTDLRNRGGDAARPPILRLPEDVDGDGPVLYFNGRDYRDSDVTNPERMHDFALRLDDIRSPDDNSAIVTVEYLEANRPQLMLHPAPGNGNFKSPDIELVNTLGPLGIKLPVIKGATNTIEVTVHNVGSLAATEDEIRVRWLPFTLTGAGEWHELPPPGKFSVPKRDSVTLDSFVKLRVPWFLDKSEPATHFCVRVDVVGYNDPVHPEAKEIRVFDNWAQSNFDTTTIGFGSPSDRHVTSATATNTLARKATYEFDVFQSTPWYRIYLGNAWLELESGETRAIALEYESLAGDPVHGAEFDRNIETIASDEHRVAVLSSVLPENTDCSAPRRVFGCGLTLHAGRRVVIDEIGHNDEVVFARVRSVHDGNFEPVFSGTFLLAAWPDDDPANVNQNDGRIRNGSANVDLPLETLADLRNGRPTTFVVGYPGDDFRAAVATPPAPL